MQQVPIHSEHWCTCIFPFIIGTARGFHPSHAMLHRHRHRFWCRTWIRVSDVTSSTRRIGHRPLLNFSSVNTTYLPCFCTNKHSASLLLQRFTCSRIFLTLGARQDDSDDDSIFLKEHCTIASGQRNTEDRCATKGAPNGPLELAIQGN